MKQMLEDIIIIARILTIIIKAVVMNVQYVCNRLIHHTVLKF